MVDRMVASIREFGFRIPVLSRSSGDEIDGHLRAAEKLGMTEVPVILCDDWSDAQVKAFRLLVNRSVNWAAWDMELLTLEMMELQRSRLLSQLTSFDGREIDALLLGDDTESTEDTIADLPENPVTSPGDVWLCGRTG